MITCKALCSYGLGIVVGACLELHLKRYYYNTERTSLASDQEQD
jgi:hypothetical protein